MVNFGSSSKGYLFEYIKLYFLSWTTLKTEGFGAAVHQTKIIEGKPVEGSVVFILRQLKYIEIRYGSPQLEAPALVWALEKLHYYLNGSFFEVITDCIGVRSLMNSKTPNRHLLRWMIAIQEYRTYRTITHRPGNFTIKQMDWVEWLYKKIQKIQLGMQKKWRKRYLWWLSP